jgi:predicted N-acetyltransferase YhbS
MYKAKPMRTQDFQFAVQLSNTMNWNMTPSDFALAVELEPQGCFVAMDSTEPVGIATCLSYGAVGWFGNLIVKEGWRRRGAGSFLVKHAINYLQRKGAKTVGLYAYPQLTGFYGKLGFRADEEFAVMHAKKPISHSASAVTRIGKDNFPKIALFDKGCFGGKRRKLLEKVLFNKENVGFYDLEEGKTAGFAVAKLYGDMAEIGPLICLPQRQDVAQRLLGAVVSAVAGRETYLCLPKKETALCRELSARGFAEDFTVKRMFFGEFVAKNCISIAESLERG